MLPIRALPGCEMGKIEMPLLGAQAVDQAPIRTWQCWALAASGVGDETQR